MPGLSDGFIGFVVVEFDWLNGKPTEMRKVTARISNGYVYLKGGPTGYESAPIEVLDSPVDWVACSGTKGRYARCTVPAAELARLARAYRMANPA